MTALYVGNDQMAMRGDDRPEGPMGVRCPRT